MSSGKLQLLQLKMKKRLCVCRFLSVALFAVAFGQFENLAVAADAIIYSVLKGQIYQQDNPIMPWLLRPDSTSNDQAMKVDISLDMTASNSVTSASVQLPNGTNIVLSANSDGDSRDFNRSFEHKPELDAEFPNGNYTMTINGTTDGTKNIVLSLTGDAYPNVPRISNWEATQDLNPTNAFTLTWDSFTGGTVSDFVYVMIEESGTNGSTTRFESSDPGQAGSLNGTSNSIVIPGGTLMESKSYSLSLGFFKIVTFDTTYAQGVAAYFKETRSSIRTTLGADANPPSLMFSQPFAGASNVKNNSIISFVFSELMDTNVNVGAAIAWTGLNPASFTYSWGSGGKTLYCNYTPGLPLNTNITWTLNPNGASVLLKDLRGNALNFTSMGNFSTLSASNLGQPDVQRISLFKAEIYQQKGTTPVPSEEYVFVMEAELNGFSTASSVSVTGPGGGPVVVGPESNSHGDSIDLEAEYAFKSDLDQFLPNGNYTITFTTFHDGNKTVTLDLSPDNYPNTPTILNFSSLSNVNPNVDLVLNWTPMTSPGSGDFIAIELINSFDRTVFEKPFPGEVGVLPGSATSITIPAGTLPPGRKIEAEIIFGKADTLDTTGYPGVFAGSAFLKVTSFEVTTTGTPIAPQLHTLGFANGQFQLRLIGEHKVPYTLQSLDSLNNTNWMNIFVGNADATLTNAMGTFDFTDQNSMNYNRQYYRALEGFMSGDSGGGGGGNTLWSVAFYPGLDLTQCNGGSSLAFNTQSLGVNGNGSFSETWSPGTPRINVTGTLVGNSLSATLNCISGFTQYGSIAATENNGFFTGTYTFENNGVAIIVPLTDKISVQGRVIDAQTKNPIQGATVTTTIGGSVTTDAGGFFFLQTNEPVKNGAAFPYAIDIMKQDTHSSAGVGGVANWGDHPTGQLFEMTSL